MSEVEFESSAIALLSAHEERIEALETQHEKFYLSLILALKTSGIDLVKAMSFIESRRPTLDVSVAAAPVTTNQSSPRIAIPIPIPTIVAPTGNTRDGGAPSPKESQ